MREKSISSSKDPRAIMQKRWAATKMPLLVQVLHLCLGKLHVKTAHVLYASTG